MVDHSARAKEIINKIKYITIATASKDGQPWNAPVYAAFDEHYNFYWASWNESQHSKNIRENEAIFIVIYDSTVPEGTGEGVYIQAKAYELNDKKDIESALLYYPWRSKASIKDARDFLSRNPFTGDYPRQVYKAVPEKVWVSGKATVNGEEVDQRISVKLI